MILYLIDTESMINWNELTTLINEPEVYTSITRKSINQYTFDDNNIDIYITVLLLYTRAVRHSTYTTARVVPALPSVRSKVVYVRAGTTLAVECEY